MTCFYAYNEQDQRDRKKAITNYIIEHFRCEEKEITFISNEKEYKGIYKKYFVVFSRQARVFEIYDKCQLLKFHYSVPFLKKYLEV